MEVPCESKGVRSVRRSGGLAGVRGGSKSVQANRVANPCVRKRSLPEFPNVCEHVSRLGKARHDM